MAEPHPQRWQSFFETEQEVRRLFRELIHQPWGSRGQAEGGRRPGEASAWQPQADLWETDEAIMVEVELPGVTQKDVSVTLSNGILTIKGEKKSEREEKKDNYYMSERVSGSFERSLRLPDTVDENKLEAKFDSGVLKIIAQKKPEAVKAEKKIEIAKS